MSTQNENNIFSDDDIAFPLLKKEYYYRCRISNVEKAKSEYNKCVNVLLGNSNIILSNVTNKEIIINKLKMYYKDFNDFSKKIIDMDGIESKEQYICSMELMMCTVQETVIFVSEKFGLLNKKIREKKYNFQDDLFYEEGNVSCDNSDKNTQKLSYIINQIANIQYYLNPDDPVNVLSDKYSGYIISIMYPIGIFLLLFVIVFILTLLKAVVPIPEKLILYGSLFIATVLPTIGFFKFIYSAKYVLAERKSRAYKQIYRFVIHPYKDNSIINKSKILKAIKEFVSFVKFFKR